MNEIEMQNTLLSLIQHLHDAREEIECEDDDIALADIARDMVSEAEGLAHADTFDGVQLLTSNKGLVLRMEDGSEFQISIVQSR
ncbi:MAG TPA: hypothetical protein VF777_10110 [Phycisphaerales bacterium]